MSIGAELAAARRKAGLTVTEVSQRTRIREAIVRGIERDDFSACGGDFYARGHIRAIARVAGLDPEPLVREYDDAREAVTQETIPVPRTGRPGSAVPARPPAAGRPAPAAPGRPAAPASGRATAAPGGPAAAAPGRPASAAGRTITVTSAEMPGRLGPPPQLPRGGPRVPIWGTVLVALLAAAGGVLVYHAVSSHQAGSPAAARSSIPQPSRPAVTPRASPTSPTATPTPTPTPTVPPGSVVISLVVAGEPCWAEITTADGTTVFQGTVQAGTTMSWTEGQAVTLTLGNPGAVTLTVNGQARNGLGVNPVTLNLAPAQ
jgi:cytoskeleton protein RodZ